MSNTKITITKPRICNEYANKDSRVRVLNKENSGQGEARNYGMKYAITEMLKTGGGSIVNVASAAGLIGSKLAGQYGTAKHAVVGLTKCGALDYAENNIRINAVAPGAIKTEIFEEAFKRGAYTEESLASTHPMKRMGLPIEVARSILFLADDKNSFTTGTILSVDGGYIVP